MKLEKTFYPNSLLTFINIKPENRKEVFISQFLIIIENVQDLSSVEIHSLQAQTI